MNYNISKIQANFKSLIGFKMPFDPNLQILSDVLKHSDSGIIINDGLIPYLTLQNIKDLGLNYNLFNFNEYNSLTTYITNNRIKYPFPAFDATKIYEENECVILNSIGYRSLINANLNNEPDKNLDKWSVTAENYLIFDSLQNANLNNQPDINPNFWIEINLFSAFLESRLNFATINVLQKVIETQNRILEQKKLYYGIGKVSDTITENTKWAGLRFNLFRNKNIKVKINRIGLHFTQPNTDLTFYLYNQNTLISTFTASNISDDFIWVNVKDIEITGDKAGSWYLFYKRSDVYGFAVNNKINIKKNTSNFLVLNQFEVPDGTDLKTINESDFKYYQSNIANIDFSVVPDLTNWLIYNKLIFASAIKLQFAIDIYKMFLANENVRANRTERNINIQDLRTSIYSKDAETILKQLLEEIENLRLSFGKAKIDNINLPKDKLFKQNIFI